MEEIRFVPYFIPGRYRRGDQMMHVLGPLIPTVLPLAERGRWREVTEEEWNATLARVRANANRRQPPEAAQ